MDIDLDFLDARAVAVSLIIWLVCIVAIWKFTIVQSDIYTWKMKLLLSAILLPICYIITSIASNK